MSSMLGNQGMRGAFSSQGQRGPTGQMTQGQRGGTGDISGFKRIPNFTPEMMQLFQQMFGEVGPESFTGRLAAGEPGIFEEIEAPAMKQFAGLQGSLASRFSKGGEGRGALGARRSSGFQNTANQAASDFAQQLQSQRQGLQSQAIRDLFGMKESLLGQQPYSLLPKTPKPPGFLENLLGFGSEGAGGGIGKLLGKLFGI